MSRQRKYFRRSCFSRSISCLTGPTTQPRCSNPFSTNKRTRIGMPVSVDLPQRSQAVRRQQAKVKRRSRLALMTSLVTMLGALAETPQAKTALMRKARPQRLKSNRTWKGTGGMESWCSCRPDLVLRKWAPSISDLSSPSLCSSLTVESLVAGLRKLTILSVCKRTT